MTFGVTLEQADGTPAQPPSIETTVLRWEPGDTIPAEREPNASGRLRS